MSDRNTPADLISSDKFRAAASLASEVIAHFSLSDLTPLLKAVEQHQSRQDLNLAILGRFKAGKSSLVNHLIGKPLLPVGVLPVTAVVTEIEYGEQEVADVVLLSGEIRSVSISEISSYISESENPQNVKRVATMRLFHPSLLRFQGLRLVDTPGLESIFAHNTEASLSWTPNVDMAVVAIAVDSPLSRQDIALIERLYKYTPNVAVLLTKVDILSDLERHEVQQFVSSQLQQRFGTSIAVFPYSIKPGYEPWQTCFEQEQILGPLASAHLQHTAVLVRKSSTLLRSAQDYLHLIEKAAERTASEREELREQVLGSKEFIADQKLQLQLLARHAAAKIRSAIDAHLQQSTRQELEQGLKERLKKELPEWGGSFAKVLTAFERWLREELTDRLSEISAVQMNALCQPLRSIQTQCQRNLQNFRDQLSEKVLRLFGTPLRTAETEIEVQAPPSPDISVGRVFDHNWELISFVIPMPLVRRAVEQRFSARVEREVYKNLSRLTSQWEERIQAAIFETAKGAERRFDELITTISHLLSNEDQRARSTISSYLDRVRQKLKELQ